MDEPGETTAMQDEGPEATPPPSPRTRRAPARPAEARTRASSVAPVEQEPEPEQEPAVATPGRPTFGRPGRDLVATLGLVVVLFASAAGLGAAAVLERRPAVYHSQAVLLIDEEPALTSGGDDGILTKLTRLRIKYVDIVQTTVFADSLATRLNLPASRLEDALGAGAPPSSLLLTITADDEKAKDAKRIAQGAAELLRDQLGASQTAVGIKKGKQVTFTVVSPATTGTKTSPSSQRVLLVGAVVFLAVLAGGLVLLEVFRRRPS